MPACWPAADVRAAASCRASTASSRRGCAATVTASAVPMARPSEAAVSGRDLIASPRSAIPARAALAAGEQAASRHVPGPCPVAFVFLAARPRMQTRNQAILVRMRRRFSNRITFTKGEDSETGPEQSMPLCDPDQPGFPSGTFRRLAQATRSRPVRPGIAFTPDDTAAYVSTGGRLVTAEWQSTAQAHVGYVRERPG